MHNRRGLLCLMLMAIAALPSAGRSAAGESARESTLIETVIGADDPVMRAAAAEELGRLEPVTAQMAGRVVPVLVEALNFDIDFPVRGRAAEALGRLGPVTGEVVPTLTAALEWDAHLMVRWRSVEALEHIAVQHPETAEAILPTLLTALQSDDYPGVRARAAKALGTVDPGDAVVVPALVRAFRRDAHPGVRWQAAASLEKVAQRYEANGTVAAVADLKDALAALAEHPHPDVQRNAEGLRRTIRRIEGQKGPRATD